MKNARRRARELALQGVYEWLLSGNETVAIEQRIAEAKDFGKADAELLAELLRGVTRDARALEERIGTYVDRPVGSLSPVERAILLLGTYELVAHLHTPYRVVINEAIELAKAYGGADGHKYVNGVLDKLATELRPVEAREAAARRERAEG